MEKKELVVLVEGLAVVYSTSKTIHNSIVLFLSIFIICNKSFWYEAINAYQKSKTDPCV